MAGNLSLTRIMYIILSVNWYQLKHYNPEDKARYYRHHPLVNSEFLHPV